jgi:preprotein translocase subunit SecY
MASAAEQLAANMNFGVLAKATDLKKRIWFTVIALVVYRLGTWIPMPGVNPQVLGDLFHQTGGGGILGMFDMLAGGALQRMTVFALNIMPYISASIIMQLMATIVPSLEAVKKEGEQGRKKINQYTRYLTVIIAAFQSYGIAAGLLGMNGSHGPAVMMENHALFTFTTVVTLTGGTLFLMWLGEQITARGIGQGTSLIIMAGIVAQLPHALAATLELGRTGALPALLIVVMLVMSVAVVGIIVFMERAQRRIIVQYPKRQVGNKMYGGEASHMPLKLNTSGVIPPIFASSILLMPATVAQFAAAGGPEWLTTLTAVMGHGQPLYLAMYSLLIIFFAFFYTAVVFNPVETADNLKKYGGFIPGIRPGKNTSDYLDYVLTRLTVVGAAYLTALSILPEVLIAKWSLPFYFGGTSLLIVVTVTMDTVSQIQSHLLAHQYEGLIKRSRLRGKRG